jgi:hypothetical protein
MNITILKEYIYTLYETFITQILNFQEISRYNFFYYSYNFTYKAR